MKLDPMYFAAEIEARLGELSCASSEKERLWRAIYTQGETAAKILLRQWMEKSGMSVYEDEIGNLFGRIEGCEKGVVLVGSHMDTVRGGGRFDGAVGILSGISSIGALYSFFGKPQKTVEVVALTEEEGSRFESGFLGSRAVTGEISVTDLEETDQQGVSLRQAMEKAGYIPDLLPKAQRSDLEAYIELHVEQGCILENKKAKIGIVHRIVGLIALTIHIVGEQNHAGTTPMRERKDPLWASVEIIKRMINTVMIRSETATVTVGSIEAFPGMSNVIPEEVAFSIDLRDRDEKTLRGLYKEIIDIVKEAETMGIQTRIEERCVKPPVELDRTCVAQLTRIVDKSGLPYLHMDSGAGHDAQIFAPFVPSCMIFIPSQNGKSHCKEEYTSREDLGAGFEILTELIKTQAW